MGPGLVRAVVAASLALAVSHESPVPADPRYGFTYYDPRGPSPEGPRALPGHAQRESPQHRTARERKRDSKAVLAKAKEVREPRADDSELYTAKIKCIRLYQVENARWLQGGVHK